MRLGLSIITALALTACTAKAPLSLQVVRSEMTRNPEASYIDGLEGTLKWNYTTGLELLSFLDAAAGAHNSNVAKGSASAEGGRGGLAPVEVASTWSPGAVVEYVDAWYDAIIAEDGTIGVNYKKSNYSVDHICPGRTLFPLYRITGKEKYRLAMDKLYEQVKEQPRTPEGGFWHKQVYPQQMWLDGLYMMQPFYAEYTANFIPDKDEQANFEDIARQFLIVAEHTYDPATGLYRHAWDSSRQMFWADKVTGQSAHAWGRAMGWYMMALVDVLPHLPANVRGRDGMISVLRGIVDRLPEYADPATGMWYQVLDQPGREGNYVEATASAMFVYAMLKGCRYGYLDCLPYAKECYTKLLDTFVTYDEDGLLNLNDCCEVAGLGGKQMRNGSYEYYITENVRANDPKGIGPLIWAALEYEKL